jgi:hypothetical protein
MSDVALTLERLIRSRDSQRLIAVGDQRVVVLNDKTGQRLAEVDNGGVSWMGHGCDSSDGKMVAV